MADKFDEFLEEVQNDIKQEKYLRIWQQYGKYITAGALTLLGGAVAFVMWQNYQESRAAKLSDTYLSAQAYIDQGKTEEAHATLEAMQASNSEVYGYLARFQQAATVLQNDKASLESKKEALRVYESIKSSSAPSYVRDYAALLYIQGMHTLQVKPAKELIPLLEPLCKETCPWHFLAREYKGVLLHQDKQNLEALEVFAALSKDKKLPKSMAMRVQLMTQTLSQNLPRIDADMLDGDAEERDENEAKTSVQHTAP